MTTQRTKKTSKPKTKYSKGDKVVYPMHGVGHVSEVDNKTILGEEHLYYVIHIASDDMKVMIPVDKADELGLRPIVSEDDIKKSLHMLMAHSTAMDDDWKVRFANNKDKIKTGSIFEVSEVVRNLYQRNKVKELSSSEKKLYETAYQLLVDEISLKRNSGREEIENLISEKLEEGQHKAERRRKAREKKKED